ncbi:MAG: transcriptional repressor LexA [Actinomycetota bacterium]
MSDLTSRQQAILDFILQTHRDRGYPPTVREIGDAVGLSSPSSVHAQIRTLVERGYLRKDADRPRAIVVTAEAPSSPVASVTRMKRREDIADVPVVGRIAAGTPILAEEAVDETLPLPTGLIGSGQVFALRVRGDSMIEAGILDGDLVVVRQQSNAEDGDIVAALVDDEATVKTLRRRKGTILLEPANQAYAPIIAPEATILGKVVSVLRRL